MGHRNFKFPVTSLVGSNLSNIYHVRRDHHIELRYYPKLLFTVFLAAIFEIPALWERIRWNGRIRDYRMQAPPVFIIGFWRSGTTLLHNLLCKYPGAGYTTTFQTVFPHLTLVHQWWLKRLSNLLMPSRRPFDNVPWSFDSPQEEEFALANVLPDSIYNFFLFPADFDRVCKKNLITGEFGKKRLENWKKQYSLIVRKSLLSTGGVQYISKNPCNMVRIGLLKEMYPGARFIFIFRNPYQVVESLYRFIHSIFPGVQLQDADRGPTREDVARLYVRFMRYYFTHKSELSSHEIIEIRMEDFMNDPVAILEKIYRTFHLEGLKDSIPHFKELLVKAPDPENHNYDIVPETYQLVNELAGDIVERLGYPVCTGVISRDPIPV